ncbi:MAG TPA: sigma-70 family RNA polymerase sigma factor [Steroidobacteraceae bacterium]|nr:sigma-70 family RNA polymerase sigma factor [Steroidobacteraceae bacterium]
MAGASEPDETLMARYASGDMAAFDALYGRHELKLWRFLQRSVRNRATADELMQDVWFTVAREAARYRPTARFTTWLFTLAHHRMIDAHRAASARPAAVAAGEGLPQQLEQLPDTGNPEPMQELESRDATRAILEAVERLPAEQREAFLMQAEGGLSVQEIAAATGSSFETAKSRLRYARGKLQEWLRESV